MLLGQWLIECNVLTVMRRVGVPVGQFAQVFLVVATEAEARNFPQKRC
jgi:hypothetical protein